jgi:hypothetical protein
MDVKCAAVRAWHLSLLAALVFLAYCGLSRPAPAQGTLGSVAAASAPPDHCIPSLLNFTTVAQMAGTDKIAPHHYDEAYDKYLQPLRCQELRMLEIGLGCGYSKYGCACLGAAPQGAAGTPPLLCFYPCPHPLPALAPSSLHTCLEQLAPVHCCGSHGCLAQC